MSAGLELDEQRYLLSRITAYRDICESVRRSSTGSLVFGALMLGLWYFIFGQRNDYGLFSLIYLGLAGLEFVVGLVNRLFPSAEGVLLDGLVLIAFGGANLARCYIIWQAGFTPPIISVVFGGYWLWTGASHVRSYNDLRKIFNPRPTSEHMRWYSGLLADIRKANPQEDPNALDLPTKPPIRILLLGNTAFLVEAGSDEIVLLDREDVTIEPMTTDPNSGKRMATLHLHHMNFDPFTLDADNWRNYSEWKRAGGESVPSVNFT